MVILELFGVYLALAVLFYLGLAATPLDASLPAPAQRARWQRARRVKDRVLRRLRPLLLLRLPRRPR